MLIVALLGSFPCRAAESARAPGARVRAFTSDPARLEALCKAGADKGARVRILRRGRAVWLDVSAETPAALARALEAIGNQAGVEGVKVRLGGRGAGEDARAVSAKPISVDPPRRAGFRPVAASVLPGGVTPETPSRRSADPPQTHWRLVSVSLGALSLRAPPA